MTVLAALAAFAAKPIVRRIFNAIAGSPEIRKAIAAQIAKQEQEAAGRIDPVQASKDAEVIDQEIADVATALEENAALQAEIRAGMNAMPSATRLDQ